jgi:UDP-N-acetyl-D-glucosamine dehydrogenase
VKRDVAVIGAGYVGLPLAARFAEVGRSVVCVDPDADRVAQLNAGESYIGDVDSEELGRYVAAGLLAASTDPAVVAEADAILICVPTPLTKNREPDLSIVMAATRAVAPHLREGHLVVLESTTYPGTTRDELLPVLAAASGLEVGVGFFLAMSPERIDPGRTDFTVKTTPKVVGGITEACTKRAALLYSACVDRIVEVTSPEAAELTKLLENIFRSVNIALMNEMAMLGDRMGLDIWEVVDAAATKPFGFMSFKPGPGLGGHCLPLDPFYLSWKAREYDFYTEFIELAGKVNENMPHFCRDKIARALNRHRKALAGSRVLLLGVSYKADIADMRESPALKLLELLRADGADLAYHDPFVPTLEEHGLESVELTDEELAAADAIVIVTAHSELDYERIVRGGSCVVDLRNATGTLGKRSEHVVKL